MNRALRPKYTGGLYEGKRPKALRVAMEAENGREGIRAQICRLLRLRNIVFAVTDCATVKTSNGPRQMVYPDGWTDITAILPITGRAWLIEVKTEKGLLRGSQVDMHAEIATTGAVLTVARSKEDVRALLNNYLAQFSPEVLNVYFSRLRQARSEAKARELRRHEAVREKNLKMLTPTEKESAAHGSLPTGLPL